MQETLDTQIVRDALFNPNFGKFRGGGDAVGAALANFINAREDARARALRNIERNKWQNEKDATPINENQQTGTNQAVDYYNRTAPSNILYSFGSAFNNAEGSNGNNIDYSFPARQGKDPNDYTFQNAMPTEQNGFHLGDYPQTEMYGDPKDWQRQMVRNAAGLNGDSKWFNPSVNGDNIMNIKDQGIGQNYNNRINSQYPNGTGIPRSPQGFGQILNNAENAPQSNTQTITGNQARQFNQYRQDLLRNQLQNNQNPSDPASVNQQVQAESGVKGVPQSQYQEMVNRLGSSKYLNDDYLYDNWNQRAKGDGINGEATRRVMYEQRIKPLIEQARDDRIREAFRIANTEGIDDRTKMDALADLAYTLKKEDLVHDWQYKREAEDRARQKWEFEKERMEALRANGFSPLRSGGGGGGGGRPRSGNPRPSKVRPNKLNLEIDDYLKLNPNLSVQEAFAAHALGIPPELAGTGATTSKTTGNNKDENLRRQVGVPGIYMNPNDPEHYMDEADNYIVLGGNERNEYITPIIDVKSMARDGAIGTSDVGDIWDSVTSNIKSGLEKDRQERREEYKNKTLKGLRSRKD